MVQINLLLNSIDDLRAIIGDVLDERLRKAQLLQPREGNNPEHEFLTVTQSLQFLHISKTTLRKLRKERKLVPVNSTDKRILFRKADLINYLTQNNK